MDTLQIRLSNIHCDQCEVSIFKSLSHSYKVEIVLLEPKESAVGSNNSEKQRNGSWWSTFTSPRAASHSGSPPQVLLRIVGNDVFIYASEDVLERDTKRILKNLESAGFGLVWWEVASRGDGLTPANTQRHMPVTSSEFRQKLHIFTKSPTKTHLKNCTACSSKRSSSASDSTLETLVDTPDKEFRAVFAISGMSCSACSNTINSSLSTLLQTDNLAVNLLNHTVVVIIPNKQLINKIIDTVSDLGFEATLIEVLPVQTSINRKIVAIIGGITCAACATSISSAVNELPFVLECGINVVTKTGQFVLEDDSKNLDVLRSTVEDCGFDFEIVKNEPINYTSAKKTSRTINLHVEGMYCNHCSEIITNYLSSYGEEVIIEDPITLDHPYIKFTYIPDRTVTARKFLSELNHLQADGDSYRILDTPGTFKCNLIQPVSMEEHLRKLSRREVSTIVRRLVVATVFAIPTFVFGIVAMSLLSKTHPFRIWVEEPLWVGNVSRNTWILLFLSTPVYFYSAEIFHRKAIKEIRALWFNKNSFKKRLVKFGSMNLLMCLGTSISYFASIVLLVLASRQEPRAHMGLHTTYFDSVVFLTFFLLIGRLLESYSKSKTADAIAGLGALKVATAALIESEEETSLDGKSTEGKGIIVESGEHSSEIASIEDSVDVLEILPVKVSPGTVTEVEISLLELNDHLLISTGESPPLDCVIIHGTSEFDESALTGESTPVKHHPGHQIFSGTVNVGNSSIIAKVVSLEGDSLIDQIVNTVRDGQLRKAPIERTADALTGYFVPVIILLAVLTWIIWLALAYSGSLPPHYLDIDIGGWTVWSMEFSIAVFVIACPCGIGLAAPTALFVGSGLAAKYGILAKGGGVAFQDGANVNVVCFDKTGTLTTGKLNVSDHHFAQDSPEIHQIALQVTRDLELSSKHPLAKAVKIFVEELARTLNITISQNKVPQVETVPGKGLSGTIVFGEEVDNGESEKSVISDGNPPLEIREVEVDSPENHAILGNESLLTDHNVVLTDAQTDLLTRWKTESKSVVLVAVKCPTIFSDPSYHLVLLLAARDEIRPEAKSVIKYLQTHDILCWMITGDNSVTAKAIASEIGIENVVSEVLPTEKQDQVRKLQLAENAVVAMVGDGINDAPALATANVGIALSSGADLAVTSSDFILLNKSHPLVTLVTLLDLSRVVFRRVKMNFAWSLVYNMVGIPIAAGVIYPYNNARLSPVWASAVMALSSICVVMSSLALKFYRPKLAADKILASEECR